MPVTAKLTIECGDLTSPAVEAFVGELAATCRESSCTRLGHADQLRANIPTEYNAQIHTGKIGMAEPEIGELR